LTSGYYALDAVDNTMLVYILKGASVTIVDATRKADRRRHPESLWRGALTWMMVFNRALRVKPSIYLNPQTPVTREMVRIAHNKVHKKEVNKIRKLERILGNRGPLIFGKNFTFEIHTGFTGDDMYQRINQEDKVVRAYPEKHEWCADSIQRQGEHLKVF
jgi:hypothetical protein